MAQASVASAAPGALVRRATPLRARETVSLSKFLIVNIGLQVSALCLCGSSPCLITCFTACSSPPPP
eukprot:3336407-Pleurochrysis_carterae.AAC.2